MATPIVKPDVPYTGKIPGGLVPGRMCRIQGVSHPEADRFDINLQTGPSSSPRDNTALHLSVRHNQGYIARNSYKDEEWGDEMGDGDLPIGHTESWEIIILVDEKDYKIAINGQHFTEFPHRIPISHVQYLLIHGTVTITLISWEGITGLGGGGGGEESSTKVSQVNAQGDPQLGGYTPQAQGGYFPPQGYGGYGPAPGYGAPPQGYGAPPQGYGAPPQGYGPPLPPGEYQAEPQKGFDFLDTAQSLLAGAIKSGAASNIIKGFMSSGSQPQGQGYAPHNAKYGIYPELPQDMNLNLNQNKQEPNPIEKLLSGLLSGGSNQQPTPGTNPQGQQNQQMDISALLTNLLSSNHASQVQPSQGAPNPTAPGTQQGDIGSFLTSLLSGGNQAGTAAPGAPHAQPGSQSTQGVDIGNLLSGLLSGNATRPLQENTGNGVHQPASSGPQSQGPDFSSLLSGLLSGGSQQNPQGPGGYQNPPGHQQPPGTHQSQGIDLSSLLSGLLSTGGQQPGGGQQLGGYQPPGGYQPSSVYQPPRGNNDPPGGYQPPRSSGGQPGGYQPPKPSGASSAKTRADEKFEDVSDQLEREMAHEGGGGTRQRPQSGQEQYGQYPHPPQEHRGPLENLLSGLLSGGGQQAPQHHPPQQQQFGGGPSVGGLGSMSGLLENFAGSILHPRDPNRQNY